MLNGLNTFYYRDKRESYYKELKYHLKLINSIIL